MQRGFWADLPMLDQATLSRAGPLKNDSRKFESSDKHIPVIAAERVIPELPNRVGARLG
jgi:hypothetical protein